MPGRLGLIEITAGAANAKKGTARIKAPSNAGKNIFFMLIGCRIHRRRRNTAVGVPKSTNTLDAKERHEGIHDNPRTKNNGDPNNSSRNCFPTFTNHFRTRSAEHYHQSTYRHQDRSDDPDDNGDQKIYYVANSSYKITQILARLTYCSAPSSRTNQKRPFQRRRIKNITLY